MTTVKIEMRDTALINLHPIMRAPVQRLIAATDAYPFRVGLKQCKFQLFEGYRSPERQNHLFAGRKVTKARPWQSAHQYGLAVDFAVAVVKQNGSIEWLWPDEAPWRGLKRLAILEGLDIPIDWDKGHVQHPQFTILKNLL